MPPAKAALYQEVEMTPHSLADSGQPRVPVRLPNVISEGNRSAIAVSGSEKARQNDFKFQPRVPVITGEATYRGILSMDGLISGQMNAAGGAISIKQRPRNGKSSSTPELDGEISFKDMLRVNGHVAGKLLSEKGTLIVDTGARIEAFIQVGVAVIGGTVDGDVIGFERVELGASAVLRGNISTPKLTIKPGAIFQGNSRVLTNGKDNR